MTFHSEHIPPGLTGGSTRTKCSAFLPVNLGVGPLIKIHSIKQER